MPKKTLQLIFELRKFENTVVREAIRTLAAMRGNLLSLLHENDPSKVNGSCQEKRLKKLNKLTKEQIDNVYKAIQQATNKNIIDAGQTLSKHNAKRLEQTLEESTNLGTKPARTALPKFLDRASVKAILTDLPIEGIKLDGWWKKQKRDLTEKLEAQIRHGLQSGETYGALVNRVNQSLDTGIKHAETLTRTVLNSVATEIDKKTFEQNEDITEWYVFEAKLDHKTSPICRSLDGKKYRYDDPKAPRPPMHFNCRSRIRPVIKWDELGLENPNVRRKTTGAKNDAGIRKRATVDDGVDYESWLKDQPKSFQDELLGVQRAKWFRDGRVNLGDLVRSDGRQITIEQLKKKLA